jgi:hypothetical protein
MSLPTRLVRAFPAGAVAYLAAPLLGAAVVPGALRAQTAPAGSGLLAGVVYDSLVTNRPLAGAEVLVAGTTLVARTDADGRFRIADVPPGTRRVTFFHPALEALRFGAPTQTVEVRPGGITDVRLLTPSPATVYRAFCPVGGELKTGVLVGRVRGADTTAAVAGARVRLSWNVFTVGNLGLVRTPRRATTETLADGSYFACNVPNDVPVQVSVRTPDGTVVVQEVALADRLVGTAFVDLPMVPTPDSAAVAKLSAPSASVLRPGAPPAAVVSGVVRRADGRPFAGARVSVVGANDAGATTGADGAFLLGVPRVGPSAVEARAIGLRPVRAEFDAQRGQPSRVALTLADNVVVLAPTVVRAPRVSAALADFDRRRNAGLGFFITANDIEVRRPYSVTDLMQMAPGVRVILPGAGSPGASPRVIFQRASGSGGVMSTSCEPIAFVDGARLVADPEQGLQLDQVIPRPQDVYGIEIYRNLTGAPPQYQALNSTCGLILIWTTRGR